MSGPASLNGTYDANVFANRAVDIIRAHNKSQPLYLYVGFHNPHDACPHDRFKNGLQAPKDSVDLYVPLPPCGLSICRDDAVFSKAGRYGGHLLSCNRLGC